MQEWFGFARNHYDRIGHFAQGFIPALIIREVLIRTSPLRSGKWLTTIVISMCLAISAAYELFEFGYAYNSGGSSNDFLGSQGDIWDAQWDMTFALIGATASMLILPPIHDRFLKKKGIIVREQ